MERALRWAGADPAHGVAFARAEASWDLAGRLRDTGHDDPAVDRGGPVPAPVPVAPWTGRRGVLGLIAASVVAVVATTTVRLLDPVERYTTRLGEERVVRLADGSVLHLNTNSAVEVTLGDARRTLALLKGEARFDVAHDPARPFLVSAGGSTVRAIGTAFNIRLRADLTELIVIKGIVAVGDGRSMARRIHAGAGAAIRDGTIAVTPLAPARVRQRMAWQNGLIEFDGDTLDQAVAEFNRYRHSPLVIGDPQLASIRIGGTFGAERSQDFVAALEAGFGIRAIAGRDRAIVLMPGTSAGVAD